MSQYLWLLDAGHGGIGPKGEYTTAPNKMYDHGDFIIHEGVINRKILNRLARHLDENEIRYKVISHEYIDLPLYERVYRADRIFEQDKTCIYVSIHSNAGGGSGNEIFTSPGQTKSDKVASIFAESYKFNMPQFPFRADRSDHDDDKEAPFYVLRKTDCPAILVENLFFDNRKEAEFLMSDKGQSQIVATMLGAIMSVEIMTRI